uniref:DJ-1/PfpI domain-containing protein n=1 Tax=Clastoptera arizonana TaxID=38151 RepID=A0A1B6E1Q3_9HEMI
MAVISFMHNHFRLLSKSSSSTFIYHKPANILLSKSAFLKYCYRLNCNMSKKSALVLIAKGTEEMECIITVDVLRRAKIEVTLAGVGGKGSVECSRGVVVVPDASLADAVKKGPYDAVILPGGLEGAKTFSESAEVGSLLKKQAEANRIVAAICAAPTALKAHKIFEGKKVTLYPSLKDELGSSYKYCKEKVVVDGTLVTSQGPGTAYDFALKLVEVLTDKATLDDVKKGLLL